MSGVKPQVTKFFSGNEMAAMAMNQMNFHVMGYFPITPSTQIAETLDAMKANGENDVVMIPADGEHGAAGICYGASTGGGRVGNATSANGLLYALEQLPVQSGTRFPMLLNVVTRSVSGPLDIKGDHSDIMYALNAGWIILMAKDPQRVYDFDVIGLKTGEHQDVRLPVIVASDGFFTSHQKRKVKVFKDNKDVQDFIGENKPVYHALDPRHPITIGPYMNEPDLINNKYQLSQAMDKAYEILPQVFKAYGEATGREYTMVEGYQMEDAEGALFILNSAFDTAKQAVDELREQGLKVGVVTTNVIRPWPYKEIQEVFKNIKVLVVCDRQESYGAHGGNMTLEIKATLQNDSNNNTKVISRIYGLGGLDFSMSDAVGVLKQAYEVIKAEKDIKNFDYIGAYPGKEDYKNESFNFFKPLTAEEQSPEKIEIIKNQKTGFYDVKGVSLRKLGCVPKRIISGHGACPGCGIFPNLNLFTKGLEGHLVFLFQTGCGMVVTTGYPHTSFKSTYIHNLFQNGAATLSGLVEMFYERKRRGEIAVDDHFTFVMVTGDGGNDIGMGPTIGTALRNHKMIIFEYDNNGYMNTGYQLSYSTPRGATTATSHVGPAQVGKTLFGTNTFHKDTTQIMAACNIPYIAQVAESNPEDMIRKAAKAQVYANTEGLAYVKTLSACPLNWRSEPSIQRNVIKAAVDSCFHPLYEIEKGITKITFNPEEKGKKVSVSEYFKYQGRTKHLLKEENKELLEEIQGEVDRRWNRLKAMDENAYL